MLDSSPRKITEYSDKYGYEFFQLRTPLTKNKIAGVPYGIDNGCYTQFRESTWVRLVDEARESTVECKFVCLPDIVGDAARTLDLFDYYKDVAHDLPRALVLQDGIERFRIDWRTVDAVFVGGSDTFKSSAPAFNAAKTARMLGKWVHVGRVNTAARVRQWIDLADSLDGSGISRYDHMLEGVLAALRGTEQQLTFTHWSRRTQ